MHPHTLGFRWKSSDNVKNQKPLVQYGYVLNTSVVFATRKLILNSACPKAAPGSLQHPRPSPSSTLIRFCSFLAPVLSGDSWSCGMGWVPRGAPASPSHHSPRLGHPSGSHIQPDSRELLGQHFPTGVMFLLSNSNFLLPFTSTFCHIKKKPLKNISLESDRQVLYSHHLSTPHFPIFQLLSSCFLCLLPLKAEA